MGSVGEHEGCGAREAGVLVLGPSLFRDRGVVFTFFLNWDKTCISRIYNLNHVQCLVQWL